MRQILTDEYKAKIRTTIIALGIRPPPTPTGADNPNWRGGPALCVDCGKALSMRTYTRCGSCARKGSLNPYHQKCIKEGKKSHQLILKSIRNSFKYRQWRSDVYTRDAFTCQQCGTVGRKLEAHHIMSTAAIVKKYAIESMEHALACDKLWDINNGVTLCLDCHATTGNYKGKNHSLLNNLK